MQTRRPRKSIAPLSPIFFILSYIIAGLNAFASAASRRYVLPAYSYARVPVVFFALSLLFLLSFSTNTLAATRTVCASGCDFTSIQTAISNAGTVNGDTILVSDGTYSENIDYGSKVITVQSVNGAAVTTIQGTSGNNAPAVNFNNAALTASAVLDGFTINNQGTNCNSRGIYIGSGAAPTIKNSVLVGNTPGCSYNGSAIYITGGGATIDNLTIGVSGTPNTGNMGVGIYATGAGPALSVSNSTISYNTGVQGGGIYLTSKSATTTITNTVITNQSTTQSGAGILSNASPLSITGSTISNNTVSNAGQNGGGLYLTGAAATASITNTDITGNRSNASAGGGIYISGGASIAMTGGSISGNVAGSTTGGGINATGTGTTVGLTGVIISGNDTNQYGGGIYLNSAASVTLTNCIVTGNTADSQTYSDGGGIYNTGATLTLMNTTVAGNYAKRYGGGQSGVGAVTNSIFWGNTAGTSGAQIYGSPTVTYSDVSGGFAGAGNVNVDPLFVTPAAASDGNPTTAGDFHIQSGSQVIGQGTSSGAPADDIDGDARGASIDMGADEYVSGDTTPPAEVTGFTVTDPTTGGKLDLSWTNPGDADFAGVKIVRATGATAPADCASGTLVYNNNGTSYQDTGLTNGTEYSYRICSYDASSNVSTGVTGSGTPTIDSTAPAAVSNLATSGVGLVSVGLTWTTPGDDGTTGTASTYDVRYRTDASITEGNWATAAQATGEPSPSVAGSTENFTVTGLTCNTTYYFALKTSDEAPNTSGVSNSISVTTSACVAVSGMVVYGEGGVSTPRYRTYADSSGFSVELSANANGAGDVKYTVLRESPTANEYLLGNQMSDDIVYIQKYSGGGWTNQWNTTGVNNYRHFDVAYEQVSGHALAVYENSSSGNRIIAYRTYNGSAWSSEQTLDYSSLGGPSFNVPRFVKLVPQRNSDKILVMWMDSGSEVYAYIWDGTQFTNGRIITTNRNSTCTALYDSFSGAWETNTGDAIVVFGDTAAQLSYATFSGGAWSADTGGPALTGNGCFVWADADSNSDRVAVITSDANKKANFAMWDGSAWEAGAPAAIAHSSFIGGMPVAVGWQRSGGKALFAWVGSNAYVYYLTYTNGTGWSSATNTPTAWTAAPVKTISMTAAQDPGETRIAVSAIDNWNALKTIIWNNGTWSEPVNSFHEDAASDLSKRPVMFEWSFTSNDTTPPGEVSSFTVINPGTGNRLDLTWTNPGDADFSNVKVVRTLGATAPADCSSGTLVYNGSGASVSDTALTDGAQYSYRICTYDTLNNGSTGTTGSNTPNDATAPANVTGLGSSPGSGQITLSWTNPGDADFAGTKVLRKTGAFPSSCTDGTATVVYDNTGTNVIDTGLTNGTAYYYRVCAHDEVPNYASGVTVSDTPVVDVTPPADVTGFTVADAGIGTQLNLSWTNPGDIDFSAVKIVRATGATAPADCASGTLVYDNSGTSYQNTGLTAGTEYSYRICAYDTSDNYAAGVTGSGTPTVDSTPPAAINDMVAASFTSTGVTLKWTAPGDDGIVGQAASYDVRYSTSNITDANWAAATQATGESAPTPAGFTDGFTVTGLTCNTTYYFAVKTADNIPNTSGLSNVVVQLTSSCPNTGIIVYGDTTAQGTPRYRLWDGSDFGAEASAVSNGANEVWFVRTRKAPTRNEYISAYLDTGDTIYVERFDGSSWTSDGAFASAGFGASTRYYDIAYEQLRGNGIIVYEGSTYADKKVYYRIWDGTSWGSEQILTYNAAGAVNSSIRSVTLVPREGSNEILLVMRDQSNEIYSYIWDGTYWEHGKTVTTNRNNSTAKQPAGAWEHSSGDALVIFPDDGYGLSYATYDSSTGTWADDAELVNFGALNYGKYLAAAGDPNSDYIAVIFSDTTPSLRTRVWNGTAWEGGAPTQLTSFASPSNGYPVDVAWQDTGSVALFAWRSSGGNTATYATYTVGTGWSVAALDSAPNLSMAWTSLAPDSIGLVADPTSGSKQIMLSGIGWGNDLRSIVWDDGSWTQPTTSYLESSVSGWMYQPFMYAWYQFASDLTPPDEVKTFTVTNPGTGDSLILSWLNPTTADFAKVKIVRADGATAPANCSSGTLIYDGPGTNHTDTGLTYGQQYSYRICTVDNDLNVSSGITGTGNTEDVTAPATVENLAAGAATASSLTLTWTAPGDDGNKGTATEYDIRYRTDAPLTDANWAAATQVIGEPSPQAAGKAESLEVIGLSSGTTYYFAMKTRDEVNNWSSISNSPSGLTSGGGGGDVTAPADITDLSAATVTKGSVTLSWTAPGDDNNTGTAASYDIRYRTDGPVTAANWGTSTQVSGEPLPYGAGVTQTYSVPGLTCGANYWFAMKTSDEAPNTSGISNGALQATLSCNGGDLNPGMLVYADTANPGTPKYRVWDGSAYGAEQSANNQAASNISYLVHKEAPKRNEHMIVSHHDNEYIYAESYNGSTWTSHGQFNATVSTSQYRVFDFAYEQASSDGVVVYEDSYNSNRTIKYRTWNGSSWSSEQTLDYSALTGSVNSNARWVHLRPHPSSDRMALTFVDGGNEVYAYVWNGSAFTNGKVITENRNAAGSDPEAMQAVWEGSSGDAMILFRDNGAGISYSTSAGGTGAWTADAQAFTMTGNGYYLDADADRTSDYVAVIAWDGFGKLYTYVWNGTAWEGGAPGMGDTYTLWTAGRDSLAVAWQRSGGKAVFVWKNYVWLENWHWYVTYTRGSGWSAADLDDATKIPTEWSTSLTTLELVPDPATDSKRIMLTTMDDNSDLKSLLWDDGVWSAPVNFDVEYDSSQSWRHSFMFAWDFSVEDATPPANVTGFVVSDSGAGNELDLIWTNPTDSDFAGVKVVRAQGGVPPADCSSGSYVYKGSGTSYTDTPLVDGTAYSYRICSYDLLDNISGGVTGMATSTDSTAPSEVTGFTSSPGNGVVLLSWTNPADADFVGTKVMRKAGSLPSSCTDGTATVVYNGSGTSVTDTGLTNGTVYYYRACSYDEAVNYSSGATLNDTPVGDTTPPADVTSFGAVDPGTGNTLNLSWVNPADADFEGVKVVREYGAAAPADCNTGTLVYDGAGTSYADNTLYDGIQASYRACAYDGSGNLSAGATVSATANDATAPPEVTDLVAVSGDTQVVLTWTKPSAADFFGVRVLRKAGGYPSSCTDGAATVVYSGTDATYTDTGLSNGTQYYYRACSYDEIPNYSTGATVTATPGNDSTAPDAVSGLTVSQIFTRGVELTWTAPGDDAGVGTASSYDMRYLDAADYPANMTGAYMDTNWAALSQAPDETSPRSAGTTETLRVYQNTLNARVEPNTVYNFVLKTSDELSNVSSISNVANTHTALKYGYNTVSIPYDASTGTTYTLNDIFVDDVSYVYMFTWQSYGLDSGGRFNGRWLRLSPSSLLTSQSNGKGYYMYAYSMNTDVLDEKNSGGTALVTGNTNNWIQMALSQGRNLVGNPYSKNVDFNNVKVCQNASGFSSATGCTGGTVLSFADAVAAGWLDGSIAYSSNETTYSYEMCSALECTAKLRPWWGQWVYLLEGNETYILAVPKP